MNIPKNRKENIKRIIYVAHVLEEANIIAIACNISPFQNMGDFCRQKFKNYSDIYLEKSYTIARKVDLKGVFKNSASFKLVGRNIPFKKTVSCN